MRKRLEKNASEFPETAESQGARHMGSPVFVALGVGCGRERGRESDESVTTPSATSWPFPFTKRRISL